jgi:hypothetical protein
MHADFAPLGDVEFDSPSAVYEFAQLGRSISAATGLIVVQAAADLKSACLTIPVMDGRPNAKAQRVTRPLRRAALHLWAVQRCFALTPKVFLATYEEEMRAIRSRARRGIDLGRGRP